jgi:hypothetical protein
MAMDDEEKEQQSRGFRVTDRRRFTETASSEAGEDEPAAKESSAAPEAPRAPEPPEPEDLSSEEHVTVPVTFSSFLLGLSTQALLLLGEIENPISHRVERDLAGAKQLIDILGMLEEKTRNNLDPSEQELLSSALFDLRMRYVELARAENKEGT